MKYNLSKAMEKCISEMKDEALEIYKDIPNSKTLKITKKPTKNKIFQFQITNIGAPMIRLIINKKFFKNYILMNGKWAESE